MLFSDVVYRREYCVCDRRVNFCGELSEWSWGNKVAEELAEEPVPLPFGPTTNSACMSMVRKEGLHGEGPATRCEKLGKSGQFIPSTNIHARSSCLCPLSEHAVNYVLIYERLPTENLSQPLFSTLEKRKFRSIFIYLVLYWWYFSPFHSCRLCWLEDRRSEVRCRILGIPFF